MRFNARFRGLLAASLLTAALMGLMISLFSLPVFFLWPVLLGVLAAATVCLMDGTRLSWLPAAAWMAACLLTGYADTYCLSLSLLLAFAMLYPEVQVLLFFVIPIRVKYFGWFAAALWALSFLGSGMMGKLNYLLCMLNFVVFFGPQAWRSVRAWVRREQWKRKNRR